MEIITHPNDILRINCEPIKALDTELLKTLSDMRRWIANPENGALGLALPQIGIAKQAFVFRNLVSGNNEIIINPRILKRNGSYASEEGCLSIPGENEMITRYKEIEVMYYGLNMKVRKAVFRNRTACIFQHEYDHLKGKLFIDYLTEN